MSVKVNRVRVKNFRSLQDIETSLGEVTLLLGANNSGKTSFLRALTVALSSDRKFISKDDLFINKLGQYPQESNVIIDVEIIPFNDTTFTIEWAQVFGGEDIQLSSQNAEFFAYRTVIDFSNEQTDAQIKRYVIKDWDSNIADENQEVTANITKLPLFFIDAQRDLQEDLKYAQSYFGRLASQIQYDDSQKKKIEESLSQLNKKAVNESNVLKHLKDSLEELNKTVQTKGGGVEITPFPKKIRDLHKGLKVNYQDGGSETFSLEYHGMGTRSWASLLGYKAFVKWMKQKADNDNDMLHPLLALEEPEAHLHPNAQRQVYSQLKKVTGQKIISTHSPYIAPLADLEELRFFYKKDDSTSITDLKDLLASVTVKEKNNIESQIIKARGELFFARLVVLFEGKTEEGALPIFAQKYWGLEIFERGVFLMNCGGGDYKLYIRLLEAFKIPWIIFSDYDNPTIKGKVQKVGNDLGVADIDLDDRFVLLNLSIEDYLIDEGYQQNLIDAYFTLKEPEFSIEARRIAERTRVEGLSLEDLKVDKKVKEWRAKMAPIWAETIVNESTPSRQIPTKIKELLLLIDKQL